MKPDSFHAFEEHLAKSGEGPYFYNTCSLKMFFKSVTESSFTVVGGLPGTGKTTLCEQFLDYINSIEADRSVKVPQIVRCSSNWTGVEDLVGRYSIDQNEYVATPFIEALLAALRDREREYFFLIDAIDLANVSSFLSDVVASLATVRPMPVHKNLRCVPVNTALPEERNLICHNDCFSCFFALKEYTASKIPAAMASFVPPHVTFPSNFHIMATVQGTKALSGFDTWMVDKIDWVFLSSIDWASWVDHLESGGMNHCLCSFVRELLSLCSHNEVHLGWRNLSRITSIAAHISESMTADDNVFSEALDLQISISIVPMILCSHLFQTTSGGNIADDTSLMVDEKKVVGQFIELMNLFNLSESATRLAYMIQKPCS